MSSKGVLNVLQYKTIIDIDTRHNTSHWIISYQIIIMQLLLQIYYVCDLIMMHCMAAEGVLGVKILTSKV